MTTAADALVQKLAAADTAWRTAKLTLEAKIRASIEKELETLKITRDLLAFQAKEAGASVTAISKIGLHTSATVTGYEAIRNGAQYAPKPEEIAGVPVAKELQSAPNGGIRYTPAAGQIRPLLPILDIEEDAYDADPSLHFADFEVDETGDRLWPLTEAFTNDVRHPVVALVMGEDATHRARIMEWAA